MYRMSHCIVMSLNGCHNVMTKTQVKLSIGLAFGSVGNLVALQYRMDHGALSPNHVYGMSCHRLCVLHPPH